MIWDKLENLEAYSALHSQLGQVAQFIRQTDLAALPAGTTRIDGARIFVNHFSYETENNEQLAPMEAHRRYLDLHVITCGRELITVTPQELLTSLSWNEQDVCLLVKGDDLCRQVLLPGYFVLLATGEGHKTRLTHLQQTHVDKLVFKIAL